MRALQVTTHPTLKNIYLVKVTGDLCEHRIVIHRNALLSNYYKILLHTLSFKGYSAILFYAFIHT